MYVYYFKIYNLKTIFCINIGYAFNIFFCLNSGIAIALYLISVLHFVIVLKEFSTVWNKEIEKKVFTITISKYCRIVKNITYIYIITKIFRLFSLVKFGAVSEYLFKSVFMNFRCVYYCMKCHQLSQSKI